MKVIPLIMVSVLILGFSTSALASDPDSFCENNVLSYQGLDIRGRPGTLERLVALSDAVWSVDSSELVLLNGHGLVRSYNVESGEEVARWKIAFPDNPNQQITVIALSSEYLLWARGHEIWFSEISPQSFEIMPRAIGTVFPQLKNFAIHQIRWDSLGKKALLEGSIFGEQSKVMTLDLSTLRIEDAVEADTRYLFGEFLPDPQDPNSRIVQHLSQNSSNSIFLLMAYSPRWGKRRDSPVPSIARFYAYDTTEHSFLNSGAIGQFDLKIGQDFIHTEYDLSPSGKWIVIHPRDYDSTRYVQLRSDYVDIVNVRDTRDRQTIGPFSGEEYLGLVHNSADWAVFFRKASAHSLAASDCLVLRDLKNKGRVVGQLAISSKDVFETENFLGPSFAQVYRNPEALRKFLPYQLTSVLHRLQMSISPDGRKLLFLRDDASKALRLSGDDSNAIKWLRVYDLRTAH